MGNCLTVGAHQVVIRCSFKLSLRICCSIAPVFAGTQCHALPIQCSHGRNATSHVMYIQILRNVAVQKVMLQLSPQCEHTYSHMFIMQHIKKLCVNSASQVASKHANGRQPGCCTMYDVQNMACWALKSSLLGPGHSAHLPK